MLEMCLLRVGPLKSPSGILLSVWLPARVTRVYIAAPVPVRAMLRLRRLLDLRPDRDLQCRHFLQYQHICKPLRVLAMPLHPDMDQIRRVLRLSYQLCRQLLQ